MADKKIIIGNDEAFKIITIDEDMIREEPKPGIYAYNPKNDVYIKKLDRYQLPEKLYGDINYKADLVLSSKDIGMGSFIAIGERGTGKTLLSKVIANRLIDDGFIIIEVEDLDNIMGILDIVNNYKVAVIIDEIGKLMSRRSDNFDPEHIITILTDKLPIVMATENNEWSIPQYLFGRPQRFAYRFDYTVLPISVIEEYVNDHLDKGLAKCVIPLLASETRVNFDIMTSFVRLIKHQLSHKGGLECKDIKKLLQNLNTGESSKKYKVVKVLKQSKSRSNGFEDEVSDEVLNAIFTIAADGKMHYKTNYGYRTFNIKGTQGNGIVLENNGIELLVEEVK